MGLLPGVLLAAGALLLQGCGMGPAAVSGSSAGGAAAETGGVQGILHGGQQGIAGAAIQLYTVGSTGNGSAATPMLTRSVTTDPYGFFNITGAYTCGQDYQGNAIVGGSNQVYLVASGGNPGNSQDMNNQAAVMMDALGPCSYLQQPNVFIWVNEVTTAAAAWALAPFMTSSTVAGVSATRVGASATNSAGITNGFLHANLLANTTNGLPATLPSNLTVETNKLYALANALASCVNSDGTTGCTPLFTAATPAGGSQPGDTLSAALNIVQHPGQNVNPVYEAALPQAPFPNLLQGHPNDWTMSLTVTGGGLYGPTALGVDSVGNVWLANYYGSVSAFNNQGTALSPAATAGTPASGGFANGTVGAIYGLAVDSNDNIFVANEALGSTQNGNTGSISILNGATSGNTLGSVVTNSVVGSGGYGTAYFYDSSIQYPESLAADSNGNIFIGDDNGSASSYVTVYSGTGSLVRGGLGLPFGSGVFGVSGDLAHGAWMANGANNTVTHADANGGIVSVSSCCNVPAGVATDAQGNAWVANYGNGSSNGSVSEIGPGCDTNQVNRSSLCTGAGGTVVLLNQKTGGGLSSPQGIVVDAAQNVWVANLHAATGATYVALAELAGATNTLAAGTAISPAGGYGLDAGIQEAFSLGLDAGGNIWVSDTGASDAVMFFGLAAPTATPALPTPTAP